MHFIRSASLAFWVAMALTVPAKADDYPFTGTFTTAGTPAAPSPDDLTRCALSFFTQDKSGSYIFYVVDLEAFKASKSLHYLVMDKGQCTYDAAHRLETCGSTLNGILPDVGSFLHDVIDQITPDFIKTTTFDTVAHANQYSATGQADGAFAMSYARCPFDPKLLAPALSTDAATLSTEDGDKLMQPDATILHAPLTADLMKAAGLSKP